MQCEKNKTLLNFLPARQITRAFVHVRMALDQKHVGYIELFLRFS